MKKKTSILVFALTALITALPRVANAQLAGPVRASHGDPFQIVQPKDSRARTGGTYGQWSARWWQYVLSIPTTDPSNPFNATGKGCRVGQSDDSEVFFLTGLPISGAVTRTECTVPAGKNLFFPLLNFVDIHVSCALAPPKVCDTTDTPEKLRAELLGLIGPTSALHASVDSVAVGDLRPTSTPYRACAGGSPSCAPAFAVTLPENNLFGIPAATYSPAVDDGFYLMIAPLAPGRHTITFGGTGTFSGNAFFQDITYKFAVVSDE
jgi:hypothetical protein